MYKQQNFLTPIYDKLAPPAHTQIQPRCFICKKFPVCNIRDDYLKTCTLIENVLGCPSKNKQLHWHCDKKMEGFDNVLKDISDFPQQAAIKGDNEVFAELKEIRFSDFNKFNLRYNYKGYCVDFFTIWKENTYVIFVGKEYYYKLDFTMDESSQKQMIEKLNKWREKELKRKVDIINTTYFSAKLECEFYEYEKGLTQEEGIRRIICDFPNGIPLKDGGYYHLATFHIEPNKVPCYHPENGKVAFSPMPYPVFIPPQKCKDKTKKRGSTR